MTNAEGSADRVEGRDRAMARLPDLTGAKLSTAMTMIEVKAERKRMELRNFAAFLARVSDDRISDLWMVEAQPAYSDEFSS